MAELGNSGNGNIEIPDLKKESKERKGGGAFLSGAQGAGGASLGGVGGAQSAGGLLALLGSKAGVLVAALALGGAGLVGYSALKGQAGQQKASAPILSPIESSIQIKKRSADGSRSLKFASESAAGSIQWDAANGGGGAAGQAGAKDAAGADDPQKAGTPEQDALQDAQGQVSDGKPRLNRGDFGQLSQSVNGGGSSSTGGQSIFGNNGAFKPKQMMGNMGNNSLMARGGSMSGARGGRVSFGGKQNTMAAQKLTRKGVGAQRAMGQLKFASRQSSQASAAGSTEGGASYAAAAFEQGKVTGGSLEGPGGGGMGDMAPAMGGGPDGTGAGNNPTSSCPSGWTMQEGGGCQPPETAGTNVTPYQGTVDSAQTMTIMALVLAVIGIALIAIGIKLGGFWGAVIAIIGAVLLAVAIVMAVMAQQMGQSVSNQYGQKEQGNVIDKSAESAKGGKQSTYKGELGDSKDVHNATEEEKNATYQEGSQ